MPKKASSKPPFPKYTVLKDTQEQKGWDFKPTAYCLGTQDLKLPTGDYTLVGHETQLCIERKATTAELMQNFFEERFERELVRMEAFRWSFLVCEFTYDQVKKYPEGSGVPKRFWKKLRAKSGLLLRRLVEIQMAGKIRVVLAGDTARDVALSIFKRVVESAS